jgi:hypothetical protein
MNQIRIFAVVLLLTFLMKCAPFLVCRGGDPMRAALGLVWGCSGLLWGCSGLLWGCFGLLWAALGAPLGSGPALGLVWGCSGLLWGCSGLLWGCSGLLWGCSGAALGCSGAALGCSGAALGRHFLRQTTKPVPNAPGSNPSAAIYSTDKQTSVKRPWFKPQRCHFLRQTTKPVPNAPGSNPNKIK